jgi:hypothetical protein
MMQFTNGFKLWNAKDNNTLTSTDIPTTKIIDGNVVIEPTGPTGPKTLIFIVTIYISR